MSRLWQTGLFPVFQRRPLGVSLFLRRLCEGGWVKGTLVKTLLSHVRNKDTINLAGDH